MRYRAVVLSLCGVLTAGVVAAPTASAAPADCVDQLVADLLSAPVPDPTTVVVVEGVNVRVDMTGVNAFSAHVRDAAVAFANCASPNPDEILPCVLGVVEMIGEDLRGPHADDEVYLRYYHGDSNGFSINGEYAISDALAIAACL